MRVKLVATVLATVMALAFMPGTASAAPDQQPLDLNEQQCGALFGVIAAIDMGGALAFDNYGSLIAAAHTTPVGAGLLFVLNDNLGAAGIEFSSTQQVVSTVARCGLTPAVEALVSDRDA